MGKNEPKEFFIFLDDEIHKTKTKTVRYYTSLNDLEKIGFKTETDWINGKEGSQDGYIFFDCELVKKYTGEFKKDLNTAWFPKHGKKIGDNTFLIVFDYKNPDEKHPVENKYNFVENLPYYVNYIIGKKDDGEQGDIETINFYNVLNKNKKLFCLGKKLSKDSSFVDKFNNDTVINFFKELKKMGFVRVPDKNTNEDKNLLNIWNRYEPEKVKEDIKKIDNVESIKQITGEEKERLQKYRVNQGLFRKKLIKGRINKGTVKCDLCEIDIQELLNASHIKPWSESNGEEKLDINNGLLLCPIHDALFDKGFISFEDDGKIVISKKIEQDKYKNFSIKADMNLKKTNSSIVKYLKWHRENLFIKP
ncbi:MAG: HNH endonuclease [Candidatus Muirbacterium halophilum]|nr:HNH endonuclease [Candidatus Muirbacterium halophilum]